MKILTSAMLMAFASTTSLWAIDAKVTSQYAAPYTISQGNVLEVENTVRVSKTILNASGEFVLMDDADNVVYKFAAGSFGTFGVGARSISINTTIPSFVKDGSYRLRFRMMGTGVPMELVGKNFSDYLRVIVHKGAPNTAAVNLKPSSPLTLATRLTRNENFNNGLNLSTWSRSLASPGNPNPDELQAYVPAGTASLGGGLIRITGRPQTFMDKKFTSGAMNSAEGFAQTYGHFEARMKMPAGKGTWAAFWLLGIDNIWPPEIDILEQLGTEPSMAYQTVHGGTIAQHIQDGFGFDTKTQLSAEYHIYAVDWRPEMIVFSVDGKETHRITDKKLIPTKPMYMVLNVAMGGTWPGPVDPALTMAMLDVDYVRVYQFLDMPAEPVRPLQLGKTSLSARQLAPGDTFSVTGSLQVGKAALQGVQAQAYITNFDGSNWQFIGNKVFGAVAANGNQMFTITGKVPANLPAGIYNIAMLGLTDTESLDPVSGQKIKMVTRGIADQFTVGQPLGATK